jgi:hypothetical protein
MSDINKTYVFESVFLGSGSTSGGTINTDDYTISGIVNGNNIEFTRLSGGTYTVDLTSLIISGGTGINTDDYTTGATLNGTVLEFTRLSGDTYTVDLSSLSVSGGTGINTDDYTTGATLNGTIIEFGRLSGDTYSVDIGPFSAATFGPVIFDCETSGNTSYVGYGQSNACKIRRVQTVSGGTYTAFWSNGEEILDKIWDDRLTYPYF